MNGRDKRRKRRHRGQYTAPLSRSVNDPFRGLCPNGCGEPGPHFVPPSFGDRGFYICDQALPDEDLSALRVDIGEELRNQVLYGEGAKPDV